MLTNYYHVVEGISDVDTVTSISGTMYGDAVVVDVTVEISGDKSVLEGGLIAEMIEQELTLRFDDIFDVDVQVKPKRVLRT